MKKAKRYDEIIEQLRAMMPNWESLSYNGKTFLQDLVYIIPELKESEDEKIRKDIISLVNKWWKEDGAVEQDFSSQISMIAWLERHGKSNMGISEDTKQKLEGNLREALEKETRESWNDFLEKQGERKSILDVEIPFGAKDSELDEVTYYIPKGFHAEIDDDKVVIKKGEKPIAWSEEELDNITAAINNLEYLKNNYVYHPMGLEPAITFLKSLKDRVLTQPKQEWSEENEEEFQIAIDTLVKAGQRDSAHWLRTIKDKYGM